MAIFYMVASIIRASSGRSAIASAAYQSASCLYSERLGRTFSYTNKEEVVYATVQIPAHAPESLKNRQNLWGSVENSNRGKGVCARFARQFVIATPKEWNIEQTIERVRQFVEDQFVSKGMCADWALHMKPGNPHVHIMLTVHPVDERGNWLSNEKKIFAQNEMGDRIPLIDPETGEQRIRIHKKGGKEYQEKLWVRETILLNDWNKRSFILDTRKAWSEHCNKYLAPENHIDHRSYKERGLDIVPQVHEGPEARYIAQRGEASWRIEENKERKALNSFFENAKRIMEIAKNELLCLKKMIRKVRHFDEGRGLGKEGTDNRIIGTASGIPTYFTGTDFGIGTSGSREEQIAAFNRRLSISKPRIAI